MENQTAPSSAEDWRKSLSIGDEVWWSDPDHGKSSGYYRVHRICWAPEDDIFEDGVLELKNTAGSHAEVLAQEIHPAKPEGLLPVVFRGMVFGYADSADRAIDNVAEAFDVVFEQARATVEENIEVDGAGVLGTAWVVIDPSAYAPCRLRLTLDVTYDLAGESADEMRNRLCQVVEMAVGNGLLTGHTEATVEEHLVKVKEIPEPLTEKELADFMLRRIENQQIVLEDIPVRLARYGLMDPIEFVIEMRERLENEKEEA